MVKKVVTIGPESTGKSTLCRQLAAQFGTRWCPEYAREYLLQHGTHYSFDNLLTIAKGQLGLEEQFVQETLGTVHSNIVSMKAGASNPQPKTHNPKLLFIDTDMYVMKVWCEYVFNDCHTWILNQAAQRHYDLYLLCMPDLPWVQDELREYPDEKPRQELYQIYLDLMINQATPWVEIGGNSEFRLTKAILAVEALLANEL
jgi:NadR type nicotinamide-nucleotide adenylyltransferase